MSTKTFHTTSEVQQAYPHVGSQFGRMLDRFWGRNAGTAIEVTTVAPERWTATISGEGWAVTGEFATSEADAIRKAVRASLKR